MHAARGAVAAHAGLAGLALASGPALLLSFGASAGLPALLVACLAIVALIAVTGAMHEDGLADMADGFGGGSSREEKLAVMRDSRIGTFGVLALLSSVLLRTAGLSSILSASYPAGSSGRCTHWSLPWPSSTCCCTAPSLSAPSSISGGLTTHPRSTT